MICLQTSELTPVFRFHCRHCAKKKAGHGFSQKNSTLAEVNCVRFDDDRSCA